MKKALLLIFIVFLTSCQSVEKLPLPENTSGLRGEQLHIDKNINEETIDNYLNREDTIYIDVRMLKDDANFEDIGGDSYLSGYINGFEIIPYPFLCNVTDLPEEIDTYYAGPSLFTINEDNTYSENYEESLNYLERLFPKTKNIFLMCGGGGYAKQTKDLLIYYGYDQNKIYNVGGFWYYKGNNAISTLRKDGTHDFTNIPYINILFDELTPKNGYKPIEHINISKREYTNITKLNSLDELKEIINNKKTFDLLVSLDSCITCSEFKPIVDEYGENCKEKIYEIEITLVKDYLDVQYTPSFLVYKNGELIKELKSTSDEDTKYFSDAKSLETWINN